MEAGRVELPMDSMGTGLPDQVLLKPVGAPALVRYRLEYFDDILSDGIKSVRPVPSCPMGVVMLEVPIIPTLPRSLLTVFIIDELDDSLSTEDPELTELLECDDDVGAPS